MPQPAAAGNGVGLSPGGTGNSGSKFGSLEAELADLRSKGGSYSAVVKRCEKNPKMWKDPRVKGQIKDFDSVIKAYPLLQQFIAAQD